MSVDKEILKLEHFYTRQILGIFEKAVKSIDPTKRVNLSRIAKSQINRKRLILATQKTYDAGKATAKKDIKNANMLLSAAVADDSIVDEILLGSFEDTIVNEYADESVKYLSFLSNDLQSNMNSTLKAGYTLGETVPELASRVQAVWDVNEHRAVTFARTQTNSVYNSANMLTYQMEPSVENLEFVAKIDGRTSAICKMYDGTIWAKTDPSIQVPPLHFSCRSRLVIYPYAAPPVRDFSIQPGGKILTSKQIRALDLQVDIFKNTYWGTASDKILKKAIAAADLARTANLAKTIKKTAPKSTTAQTPDPQKPKLKGNDDLAEDLSDREFFHLTNDKNAKLTADYEQEVQEFGRGLYITDTDTLKYWNTQMQGRDYAIRVDLSKIKMIREENMPSIAKMSKDLKSIGYSGADMTKFKPTTGSLRTNPMDIAIKRTWAQENGFNGIIPKIRSADSSEQYILFNLNGVTFSESMDTYEIIRQLAANKLAGKTGAKIVMPDPKTIKKPIKKTPANKFTTEEVNFIEYRADPRNSNNDYLDKLYKDIFTDDEMSAVVDYLDDYYVEINNYLNGVPFTPWEIKNGTAATTTRKAKLMLSAMKKAKIEKDMIVHRGIAPSIADKMIKDGQMTYGGFSSSAETMHVPIKFAKWNSDMMGETVSNNVMIFNVKKGQKGIHVGGVEAETLLDANMKFDVISVKNVEDFMYWDEGGVQITEVTRLIYCEII